MIRFRILLISIMFSTNFTVNAQNLSSHQWNDRLIIILANDQSSQTLKDQILELKKSQSGLNERRIIVYKAVPGKYQKGLESVKAWEISSNFYEGMKETSADFEVVLIGLDGGVKLRRMEFLKSDELFGVIDQMPMRQAEMKSKF